MNFSYDKFYSKRARLISAVFGFGIIFIFSFYIFQFSAPKNFPTNNSVIVSDGAGLSEVANSLKKQNLIRSQFWFVNFVILFKQERQIVGGKYYFDKPLNVYRMARRITRGDFGIEQIKTIIPEGSTVVEIGDIIKKNYLNFDKDFFIALAKPKEGYLFPDSYFLGTDVKPERVIDVMTENFEKKIKQPEVENAIKVFGKPISDIVKMASILEGEARQMDTRRIIAGILWKRIEIKMPLQVDVSFLYILNKGTHQLTLKDLKDPSPYNSYTNLGLPPTPISNPGLDSIMAAITPIQTKYLYFLSDKNGVMHYASTLDEHVKNKQKYLR